MVPLHRLNQCVIPSNITSYNHMKTLEIEAAISRLYGAHRKYSCSKQTVWCSIDSECYTHDPPFLKKHLFKLNSFLFDLLPNGKGFILR